MTLRVWFKELYSVSCQALPDMFSLHCMVVPQEEQAPTVAGLPFSSLTFLGDFTSCILRHFLQ